MKTLTLVRHAKSSWNDPLLADFDRPLNKRGLRDAPFMAELLSAEVKTVDHLVSSPARRAAVTAGFFAAAIGWPAERIVYDDRIYAAGTAALLYLIQEFDDRHRHVLLVGHNPAITEISSVLAGHSLGNVPTCGVVRIVFEVEQWAAIGPDSGRLAAYEYPKKHRDD
ncbi:MAG: histidine phosphatase family protein [Deltaproteobacteria bacterium]|nr:histidine phosphatase family protein [Candidatus Anaeroferrophillacea bacterium]